MVYFECTVRATYKQLTDKVGMPTSIGTVLWHPENNTKFTLRFDKIGKEFKTVPASEAEPSSKVESVQARPDKSGGAELSDSTVPQTEPITVYGTLTYSDIKQLTSVRTYIGTVDRLDYTINLDNGPVIEGLANYPGMMPSITFSGSGEWKDI